MPAVTAASHPFHQRYVCSECHAVFRQSFARCPLDGSEIRPSDEDPLVGVTLAERYTIEECIGEGGMGRVYRAVHTRMTRHFAIKVLYGDLAADDTNRARFQREGEAACRLSHPNLIAMVDIGQTPGGLLYLVMEYVDGRSLGQLIHDHAPFDTDRAANLLRQMASGLEHAHGRGLVHRDFKPDNVLVVETEDGEMAKILDFGIARITEEGTAKQLTVEGMLMGTPAFMSPEQAMGKPVDHRADLFSLGMVLYEMATGVLPFDGDSMAVLRQNLALDPPPMSARCSVPVEPRFEAVAARLLAKDPGNRFQSARELIDDIDDWWTPARGRRAATMQPPLPRAQRVPAAGATDGGLGFAATHAPHPGLAPTEISFDQGLLALPSPPPPRRWGRVAVLGGVLTALGLAILLLVISGGDSDRTAGAATADNVIPATGAATGLATGADAGQADAAVTAVAANDDDDTAAANDDNDDAADDNDDDDAAAVARRDQASTATPRTSRPRRPRAEPAPTLAEYRSLYSSVLGDFQKLYRAAGDDSPLAADVSTLRRELEALTYNPEPSRLADDTKALRRLERRIARLRKRLTK
jgi:eukaryotic-like serine/threonine-protein kinase